MILKWDCWARLHHCIFPNPALMNRGWVSFFGCIITASGTDKTFLTLNQPVLVEEELFIHTEQVVVQGRKQSLKELRESH